MEPNCLFRELRYRAAPSTADDGSSGFTPRLCAVPGMNCMSPLAPAADEALALKPHSWLATAARIAGSMPQRLPAGGNRSAYGTPARLDPLPEDAVGVCWGRTRRMTVG